ncbi:MULTISPECIES: hypothetical protein [Thermomonosporaceae]|nr:MULTISPECIES: hypothetical protein [Thermomonosporaceae]MDL4775471.1 hypothetical protein [Actinomadura xylanilytica]
MDDLDAGREEALHEEWAQLARALGITERHIPPTPPDEPPPE